MSYISGHSPLDVLVVADTAELIRVLESRPASKAFPEVKAFVLMEGEATDVEVSRLDLGRKKVLSWRELLELGSAATPRAQLDAVMAEMAANEACMLLYTSGTTGPPKGDADGDTNTVC